MADHYQQNEKAAQWKLTAVQYVIVGILLVLVGGLWKLQILDTQNYRALAEQNRIRKVPVLAPRGKIVDRENRLLVDNYVSTSCFLLREQVKDLDADLPTIAAGLHLPLEYVQSTIRHYGGRPKYEPIPLKQDITPDEVEFIEAHRNELPELETLDEPRRLYPTNGFAAHLIGYVGEVSEQMLDDPKYEFYEPGDVVGKAGVEQTYDELLRGKDGSRDVVVNSHGKEIGVLGSEPSVPGKTLRLTIDLDIQKAAEEALGERSGAIIAMDPRTGEILALVSHPAYDPNAFAVKIHRDDWNKLLNDPNKPLMNKAIQAQLAPGSTFKIIMSVAGLQEKIAETLHVFCTGGADFYGHYFKCDEKHGAVDIHKAIPVSCDVFFYTLAQRLGIDKIAEYAHMFGLGQRTGIDLPDEVAGTMPSEEWKLKNYHEKWYAGETISVGIGQGAIAATPVQMLRAIAGIASGGALKRPHVVAYDEMSTEMKQALEDNGGSGDKMVHIDTENWETITDAMTGTVGPGGTAASAHLDGIDFAGKTGSAQTVSNEGRSKGLGAHMKDNAWFVGLTPRRNPEIAVVILWEGGMKGFYSARRAALVVEAYVNKQRMLANNIHMPPPTVPMAVPPPDAAKPTLQTAKVDPKAVVEQVKQHKPNVPDTEQAPKPKPVPRDGSATPTVPKPATEEAPQPSPANGTASDTGTGGTASLQMGAVWNESSLNDEGMHGGYFNLPQAWTKAAKGGGR
jgi:penicillin-binding protein 2